MTDSDSTMGFKSEKYILEADDKLRCASKNSRSCEQTHLLP
jgi:hypothetical protein